MSTRDSNTVIMAFTEDQAAKLTGLTVHRLRHWARTGFFVPSFADEDVASPYSRVYSFSDLLALQVLKALRIDWGCSLQHLREVKAKLAHMGDDMWSRTTLSVLKKKVVFHDTAKGEMREPVSGQIVFEIPLQIVRAKMESAVARLSERNKSEIGHIERKRNVSHNAAVVAGTRVPVASIQRLYEDGYTAAQIIAEYPSLTETDVEAALKYDGKRAA